MGRVNANGIMRAGAARSIEKCYRTEKEMTSALSDTTIGIYCLAGAKTMYC